MISIDKAGYLSTIKKNNRGFTLVEILVVVSIILISVGVAGDLIVSVTRSYNKTRILNEIEQNGNYVMAKITNDLKNASSVSGVGAGPTNTITITTPSDSITYTIQSVTSCTGTPVVTVTRRVGGSTYKMTNDACKDGLTISSGSFTTSPLSSGGPVVTVALTFAQVGSYASTSQYAASQSFTTYVTLRSGN